MLRTIKIFSLIYFLALVSPNYAYGVEHDGGVISGNSALGYLATQCSDEGWRSLTKAIGRNLPKNIKLEIPTLPQKNELRFAKNDILMKFGLKAIEIHYKNRTVSVDDVCFIPGIILESEKRNASTDWLLPRAEAEELVREQKVNDSLYTVGLSAAIGAGIYGGSLLAVPTWGASAIAGIALSSYAASSEVSSTSIRSDFLYVLNNKFSLVCGPNGVSFQMGELQIQVSRDSKSVSLLAANSHLIYKNDLRHLAETSPTTAAAIKKAQDIAKQCQNKTEAASITAQIQQRGRIAEARVHLAQAPLGDRGLKNSAP